MTPQQQYSLVISGLKLLAASAEKQRSSLPDFVCVADEVIGDFSDAYLLVGQLRKAGLIDARAAETLERLDEFLATVPQDGSVSDAQALECHPFWQRARELAAVALDTLARTSSR